MKVLVTGAAGHLGRATCRALQAANIEFVATDIRGDRHLPYRVRIADLVDREAAYGLFEDCDTLVHIANHPNPHSANPQRLFAENCGMNINVFQAALEMGAKKIVYASSIQVINGGRGGQDEKRPSRLKYLPLDSDSPPQPANVYAASKAAGEELLRMMALHQGLESGVALRFPSLVDREWHQYIRDAAKTERGLHRHFLDEGFTWLDFADAATLILAILRRDLPGFRTYLPAHPTPVVDMPLDALYQRFYPSVPLRRPIAGMNGFIDISQITAETGWTPEIDFRRTAAS